jgi:hypothetical protein
MDGANNPSRTVAITRIEGPPEKAGFLRMAGRLSGVEPLLTRHILCLALRAIGCADVRYGIHAFAVTNSSGTNLDSA